MARWIMTHIPDLVEHGEPSVFPELAEHLWQSSRTNRKSTSANGTKETTNYDKKNRGVKKRVKPIIVKIAAGYNQLSVFFFP